MKIEICARNDHELQINGAFVDVTTVDGSEATIELNYQEIINLCSELMDIANSISEQNKKGVQS